ncbi:MAG: thioesterase family protein [Nocardioides alkalitolerans]
MRHLYACQVRWADLDVLGHVNNVSFLDYVQEARIDMLRTHAPEQRDALVEGALIVRNDATFVAPLMLQESVAIEVWVTEIKAASFTLAYEVFDVDAAGERVVYFRATSVTAPFLFGEARPRRLTPAEVEVLTRFLEPGEPEIPSRSAQQDRALRSVAPARTHPWETRVRFTDVDAYQHVNNVKYFEYFQEARISTFRRLFGDVVRDDFPSVVVAQMSVVYRRPILLRPAPYVVRSWVSRVGGSSYDIDSDIVDDGTVMARARATLVTFDTATQRAARAPQAYRDVLLAELPE